MLTWLAPGVELMTDVSPADWVVRRLRPWAADGARLESFAPDGFDGYARVFHPAGALMEGTLPPETCEALSDLLRPHTRTPERCWFCLWEGNGAFWSGAHSPALAPGESLDEAYRVAARAQDELLNSTPRVEAEARSYFLFGGPLDAACTFEPSGSYTSPNLWWPDDRAWIVVTEVDGFSTYVGGSRAVLQDLLMSQDVEAIEVTLDTHM